jgi:tetratricopeptide (TPR) repeat protein
MSRITLRELQRRNVIRAGFAYAVGGWVFVEVAATLLPLIDAPNWVLRALIIALVLLLPAVLVFSWFFEFTSDGLKRTEDVPAPDPSTHLFDRRFDFVVIGLLVGGLLLALYGIIRDPESPPESLSILISDFENGTNNELFSGVLEDTLRVGLEVAPFVEVFPRGKAAAIAERLHGAESGSVLLDIETASVVALREGVNIVIGGSVTPANDGLTVSTTALSPGDQRPLFSASETVETTADVLQAIASLSRTLRLELGDTEKPGGAGEHESFAVSNLAAAAEYLEAQKLQRSRKFDEAVGHYERALEHDPEFARAYAGLALTEEYLGRTEEAARHWQEALSRLNMLTERGQLRTLGNYYFRSQRDYAQALETYERLVERYPADNVAQNNLAVAAFMALDFERALEVGREVAARFPDQSVYTGNLAWYAMYASRFTEAAEAAQELLENDPNSVVAHTVRALTAGIAGDFETAEAAYRRMAELDSSGRSVGTEGLADLAIYRGDPERALAILERSIANERASGTNHKVALLDVMRAEVLVELDRRDEAREAVRAALQQASSDPAVIVPAASVLAELGEFDRAEVVAADLANSASRSQRAYEKTIRAQLAQARGQTSAAVDYANAAIELADLWYVRFTRARILLEAGRTDEAQSDLRMCQERIGEGLSVFLNDRPSMRRIRILETAIAAAAENAE